MLVLSLVVRHLMEPSGRIFFVIGNVMPLARQIEKQPISHANGVDRMLRIPAINP
jgi:hypothetical protein